MPFNVKCVLLTKLLLLGESIKQVNSTRTKGGGASLVWPKWILWYVPLIRDG